VSPAEEQLIEDLKIIQGMRQKMMQGSERVYDGTEDLVLKHGRWWKPQPRPQDVDKGPNRECFRNAATLAMDYPDRFWYVEGYAVGPIPILHAWVSTRDGQLVDPTWEPVGTAYLGIAFDLAYLRETITETRTWISLLDNYKQGHPLIYGKKRLSEIQVKEWPPLSEP